jgi:type I restriction enzyme S subunit
MIHIRRWQDLERWIPGSKSELGFSFPLSPLGDLLLSRREPVAVSQFASYAAITIHFDGSVDVRERAKPFKGAMFAAYSGDLVYSKIDLRNGALALIPPNLPKVVVTSEYPVYVPDTKQVDPKYLALILRSANFLQLLKSAASGTSGRKRVSSESFESLEIPLPDPDDQRALVAAFEESIVQAEEHDRGARSLEVDAVRAFEAGLGLAPPLDAPQKRVHITHFSNIEKWSQEGILLREQQGLGSPESVYDFVPLDEVASVSYGLQKSPRNRPGPNSRPYLRVANVQRGFLDLREIKYIDVPDKDMPKYRLEIGDVLLCEGNSPELVGRGAIWSGEITDCVHQNHVLRVRIRDKKRVLPEFILEYINSAQGQAYFRSKAKRTTNLASINSKEVAEMPLPLPPTIEDQERLLAHLRSARVKAAERREQAVKARHGARDDFVAAIFH